MINSNLNSLLALGEGKFGWTAGHGRKKFNGKVDPGKKSWVASPGRTSPFSGAHRLRRRSTAQGELTPELIRTAQGRWDWDFRHVEFRQSARGAAAVVVMVRGSVVGSTGRWVGWVRAVRPTVERGRQAREVRRWWWWRQWLWLWWWWLACAALRACCAPRAHDALLDRRRAHQTHRPACPATFSPNPRVGGGWVLSAAAVLVLAAVMAAVVVVPVLQVVVLAAVRVAEDGVGSGRYLRWVRADRPTAERGGREASPGRTLPFSGARLPRLPRRRTAQR